MRKIILQTTPLALVLFSFATLFLYIKQNEAKEKFQQCQVDRTILCSYIEQLPKKYKGVFEACLREVQP